MRRKNMMMPVFVVEFQPIKGPEELVGIYFTLAEAKQGRNSQIVKLSFTTWESIADPWVYTSKKHGVIRISERFLNPTKLTKDQLY